MNNSLISSKNVCFSYKSGIQDINNLNLEVPVGSIYGFLGRNGSGKSTTIRLLLGLLKPQTGHIKIFNKSIQNHRLECLSRIGALIENPSLYYHLTGRENLEIFGQYLRCSNSQRISEVLELVELGRVGDKKVREYSLGMKQRLGLASCLIHKPDLLILDEPTNGLDPQGILEMRNLLTNINEQEKTTVFISSHILSEVEKLCSDFGIIKNGEIVFQGSVKELQNSRSRNIQVEVETNDLQRTNNLVQDMTLHAPIFINSHLLLSLKAKSEIPHLIDKLRDNDIEIFELKIKGGDLEKFFLDQTQNSI